MADGNDVFYGINTGFGSLCDTVISKDDLGKLQKKSRAFTRLWGRRRGAQRDCEINVVA